MPKTETLTLEIEAQLSSALSDVSRLKKELEQLRRTAERPIDVEVDVDEGKIDKFINDLKAAGDEAERTAKLAQNIGKFAPSVDTGDIAKAVNELRQMGVTFDSLEGKAKSLGDAFEQVGSTKISGLSTNLKTVRTDLDDVRNSSDQTRSVMANMAGNVAQDLGAVGGVVGSLGVGIGQLAEYATEGNISMRELSKVAVPMAGLFALGVVVQGVTGALDSMKRKEEEWAAFQGEVADAAEEAGSALEALTEQLEEGTIIEPPDLSAWETIVTTTKEGLGDLVGVLTLFEGEVGESADDVYSLERAMADANVTQEEFRRAISEGGTAMSDLRAELSAMVVSGQISEGTYDLLIAQLDAYSTQLETTDADLAAHKEVLENSIGGINAILAEQAEAVSRTESAWNYLLSDLKDGNIETAAAKDAWNFLRDELNLNEQAMAELAQSELDERTEEQAAAAEEAAAAFLEYREALADVRDTLAEIDTDDIANIGSALTEALDLGGIAVNLQVEEAEVRAQVDELITNIQDFVDEHGAIDWSVVLDPTASALGFNAELAGMIGGLQDQFQTGIVNAFRSGGAPAAQAFIAEFQPKLEELHMTEAQAREFMGIPADGNIPLFLQLLINEEAKADALAILDSLMGVDPDNPILAYIRLAVQTGAVDPVIGEIAAQILAAERLQVPVETLLDPSSTPEQIDAAVAFLESQGITVTIPTETGIPDSSAVDDYVPPTVKIPTVLEIAQAIGGHDISAPEVETPAAQTVTVTAELDPGTVAADLDDLVAPRDADINLHIPNLFAVYDILDGGLLTDPRDADINVRADNAGAISDILDTVADERDSNINLSADNAGAIDSILDAVADDRDTDIHVKAPAAGAVDTILDAVADDRTADFFAIPHAHDYVEGLLNNVARDRDSDINVKANNAGYVNSIINEVARDRHSTVHVHMVTNPTGEPLSANPQTAMAQLAAEATVEPMAMAAPMVAPMALAATGSDVTTTVFAPSTPARIVEAPAPVTNNNFHVEVRAAVIGSRYETERVIAKAMRSYARLNGTRAVGASV